MSDRHLCLCCASCLHVTPFNCTRSSRHLLRCLPLDLLPSRGCHSVTLCVHRLSSYLATCPAHFHFCFSTNWTMSCTLVLFLIFYLLFSNLTSSSPWLFELFSTSGPSLLTMTTFDSHMSYLGERIGRRLVF